MAYGVTVNGFIKKTYAVAREEMLEYLQANVNAGLTGDEGTAGGTQLSLWALLVAEGWDALSDCYSSQNPDNASGYSLVQLSAVTGTVQSAYSKTTVTAQVSLNPDSPLPAGSLANLTNQPSVQFQTTVDVPSDPLGGVFDVEFEAVEAGAIQVAAGQLSEISVAVPGWTAVTNATPGDTGTQPEEDPELRVKRARELEAAGSTFKDAIRADVSRVEGVIGVNVFENDTDKLDALGLKPHSVLVVVRGGDPDEIAAAIFESKAAGIGTNGNTLVLVTDSEGVDQKIRYTLATERDFEADIYIEVDNTFDMTNGPTAVATAIRDYVNNLAVGRDVVYDHVKAAGFAIEGVFDFGPSTSTINFVGEPPGSVNLVVSAVEFASAQLSNITVTATLVLDT